MRLFKKRFCDVFGSITIFGSKKLNNENLCTKRTSNLNGKETVKPELTSISFGYGGGVEIEGNYNYSVSKDEHGYHLDANLNSGNNQIKKDISKDEYEDFVQLFDGVDFASWQKDEPISGETALDTTTFSFAVCFSDRTMYTTRFLRNNTDGLSEAILAFKAMFEKVSYKERMIAIDTIKEDFK